MKKFEERLRRLEELSICIREPNVPLEEAFALFEEGIKLSKGLEKDVAGLEGKVELLMNGEDLVTEKATGKTSSTPELALFSPEDLS